MKISANIEPNDDLFIILLTISSSIHLKQCILSTI
ncbi:hypothetical protein EG68_01703 [Paragonimus skrjabini miyazakii]|uniref:Uncharacterized protein n=1 Tax=Paragonimus skrjabini miyazakii TaxID=59628 RepID=A0A8S9ZBA5_9TREM|nr:hypothetical protein EG68_01703 [Paragonimus skrjabini miyazakii]